jgi:hypothetical protein
VEGPYTLFWATRSVGTALSKSAIENGTGDALDSGSISGSTLAELDDALNLTTSLSSGAIDAFVRDSSSTPVESAVASATGVNYDAAAPAFSSAEIGSVDDTSLIVTFDKSLYGSTSPSDWAVEVDSVSATVSAVSIDGSTVDLTLSSAVVDGEVVTVAYSGTGILGVDAEQSATFTAQSVTNNVSAPTSNLVVDPGFDDPSEWDAATGIAVSGSKLALDGTNSANGIFQSAGDSFTPLGFTADGTEDFEFSIDLTRVVTTSAVIRIRPECIDGPTSGDTFIGDTIPERLGGSTVALSATGTLGPYSFQVPSGATHIKLVIQFITANTDADFDNLVITQV